MGAAMFWKVPAHDITAEIPGGRDGVMTVVTPWRVLEALGPDEEIVPPMDKGGETEVVLTVSSSESDMW